MKHILLVDDELNFLKALTEALGNYCNEWNILVAENGKKGIEMLEHHPVDIVVTDLRMPVMDGYELLSYVIARKPPIPSLVMTADSSPEADRRLKALGIDQHLSKPFKLADIAGAITRSLAAEASN